MRNFFRLSITAAAAVLCASAGVGSTACSNKGQQQTPTPTAPNGDKIQIGMVLSLSGNASGVGAEAKRGVDVAVAQLNAMGGILGKQIELVVVNDKSDPNQTHQAIDDIRKGNVDVPGGGAKYPPTPVGIGPTTTEQALALHDLISQDAVLYVSPSATGDSLDAIGTPGGPDAGVAAPDPATNTPVLFRTAPADSYLAAALQQYSTDTDKKSGLTLCESFVLVVESGASAAPIAEKFKANAIGLSRKIVTTINIDSNATDAQLSGAANQAGQAAGSTNDWTQNAQCQVVLLDPTIGGSYMRAFANYKTNPANAHQRDALGGWDSFITVGGDGFREDAFITNARVDPNDPSKGTTAEKAFAVASDTAPSDDLTRAPSSYPAFLDLYEAYNPGIDPGRYGSTAYDAVILLAAAIQRVGNATDLKALRSAIFTISAGGKTPTVESPKALGDMFDALRSGVDINYEGASGSVDFLPGGRVLGDYGVWQIVNQKFVYVTGYKGDVLTAGIQ